MNELKIVNTIRIRWRWLIFNMKNTLIYGGESKRHVYIMSVIGIMSIIGLVCTLNGEMSFDCYTTGLLTLVGIGVMIKPTAVSSIILAGCLVTCVIRSALAYGSVWPGVLDYPICVPLIGVLVIYWFILGFSDYIREGRYKGEGLIYCLTGKTLEIKRTGIIDKIIIWSSTVIGTVIAINQYSYFTNGFATFLLAANQTLLIASIVLLFMLRKDFVTAAILYQISEIIVLILMAVLKKDIGTVINDIMMNLASIAGLVMVWSSWTEEVLKKIGNVDK